MNIITKFLLLVTGFISAPMVVAQQPEFDVISIRPNHTGDQNYSIRTPPGGRFTGRNITVRTLITYALDIKDFQLTNLPGWCDSDRYDIEAKAGMQDTIDPEGLRPLIRKLLESRFRLVVHRETKELPLYSLIAAKGGPKLHPNTGITWRRPVWWTEIDVAMMRSLSSAMQAYE
jgi:uncharacterized protein (TIGR03435 family)